MSRFEQTNEKFTIAYGNDHISGLFVQAFDRTDEDEPLVDEDEEFEGLTPQRLVQIAEEYDFHIELPETIISVE